MKESRFASVIVIFSILLNEQLPAFFAVVVVAIVDVVRFAVEITLRKTKHVNYRFIAAHKNYM